VLRENLFFVAKSPMSVRTILAQSRTAFSLKPHVIGKVSVVLNSAIPRYNSESLVSPWEDFYETL
jgi:hypothetical protein